MRGILQSRRSWWMIVLMNLPCVRLVFTGCLLLFVHLGNKHSRKANKKRTEGISEEDRKKERKRDENPMRKRGERDGLERQHKQRRRDKTRNVQEALDSRAFLDVIRGKMVLADCFYCDPS